MKAIIAGWMVLLAAALHGAEPTEMREWASVTGSKVKGSALSVDAGEVKLKLESGRELTVAVAKLSEDDRRFLIDHFGAEEVAGDSAKGSGAEIVTEGLAHPIGSVEGPIDAGGGSHYFVYVPKNLRKGRLAPLLHFNGSGGGNAGSVKKHIEGAELNGWIVAACVEARNGQDLAVNCAHAERCVKHLTETLPVDPKRVYFTGGSGGGAMSFYNATQLHAAGAMPHIGYIPNGADPKGGDYFVISGTNDFNRYPSACAVKYLGKSAIHRWFVAGHKEGPAWLCTEGMAWLNGRYLAKNKRERQLAAERLDYEVSMIEWIGKLAESEPHRAYYWCVFLKDEYGISGRNAAALQKLSAPLAAKPECVAYAKGITAMSEFGVSHYADHGAGSLFKHTTPKITSAAEKLAHEFAGVPMIEEMANALGQPTCGR